MHALWSLLPALIACAGPGATSRALPGADPVGAVSAALPSPAAAVAAQRLPRHALLIGNDKYNNAPLNNPVRDVEAIGKLLESQGWTVTVETNLDRKGMRTATDGFVTGLPDDAAALFYYAGHGIGLEGGNYLVPTDFEANSVEDAKEEAYPLDAIQGKLSSRRGGVSIIITDACRDEFTRSLSMSRSERLGGYARVADVGDEVYVVLSAGPGMTAADGPRGGHSPFAEALLRHLPEDRTDIAGLVRRVRKDVRTVTQGKQVAQSISELTLGFRMDGTVLNTEQELALLTTDYTEGQDRQIGGNGQRALIVAASDHSIHPDVQDLNAYGDLVLLAGVMGDLGFEPEQVALLADQGENDSPLTGARVRAALSELLASTRQGDRVWLGYSGYAIPWGGWFLPDGPPDPWGRDVDLTHPGILSADELRSWLTALSAAAGSSGRVVLTSDTNCVFSGGADGLGDLGSFSAPVTVVEGCNEAGLGFEVQGYGLLTWGLAQSIDQLGSAASWSDVVAATNVTVREHAQAVGAGQTYVRLSGQGRVQVEGSLSYARPVLQTDSHRQYGPSTVFVKAGHLDGVFAGARVALLESGNEADRTEGTIVQAGLRRARVELDGGAVATRIRQPEVRLVAPAAPAPGVAGPDALREGVPGVAANEGLPRWQREAAYLVLADPDGTGLSPPVPADHAETARWVTRWSMVSVFEAWLGTLTTGPISLPQPLTASWNPSPPDAVSRGISFTKKCQDGADLTRSRHGQAVGIAPLLFAVENASETARYLHLLRQAPDGALTPLTQPPYDHSLSIPPGETYNWCARKDDRPIIAVLTETPWDPAVLIWVTQSVPDPGLGPLQPSRDDEIPRGLHGGPSLDSLDGEGDGVWIQLITP